MVRKSLMWLLVGAGVFLAGFLAFQRVWDGAAVMLVASAAIWITFTRLFPALQTLQGRQKAESRFPSLSSWALCGFVLWLAALGSLQLRMVTVILAICGLGYALVRLPFSTGELARRMRGWQCDLFLGTCMLTVIIGQWRMAAIDTGIPELIAAIETYHTAKHHYPHALTDLPGFDNARFDAIRHNSDIVQYRSEKGDALLIETLTPPYGRRVYLFSRHSWSDLD